MSLEKIRWGVIGAGNVFEFKSGPALYKTPHSELVAVMRTSEQKAQDVATRHGAKRWYTDAASLVNDPDVNAVYIASPHYLHPEHVALAARAKKIVFSEKPLGVTTAQAQTCVDACKENGVSLTIAYYRRFWAITQAVKKILHEGAIGRVVQARIGVSDWFAGDNERTWLLSREKSGGDALANVGAHWIDLVRYLLGEPREVVALTSSAASGFETDDTVGVDMRLDNNALVSLLVTRRTPISTNEFDIFGTEGCIRVSSLVDGKLILYRKGHDPEPMQFARIGVMHSELVAALVPSLLKGEPSPLPGEEAVAVWRVMQAAYHSAETGTQEKI